MRWYHQLPGLRHVYRSREIARRERDAASGARAVALSDRDKAIHERDAALAAQAVALSDRDKAIHERDAALAAQAVALSDRDKAIHERDAALAAQAVALSDRDKAIHERDAVLAAQLSGPSERDTAAIARHVFRVMELPLKDLFLMRGVDEKLLAPSVALETRKPVAVDSDDHRVPWGTKQDNTRSPRFVAACERRFRRPLTFLDLGCAGGGLVLDFLLRRHQAYGIEGSDYSLKAQRAEWRLLQNNLFTADITQPFFLRFLSTCEPVRCDVVSAWEVLEHIAADDLPQLFDNVKLHLKPDGIFVGSISLVADDHDGASYHRTVQPAAWWHAKFRELGMKITTDDSFEFDDFCRGTGNGPMDRNFQAEPDIGMHFVATNIQAAIITT